MKKIMTLIILSLVFFCQSSFCTLSAIVDKNTLTAEDNLQLTLTLSNSSEKGEPDFNALKKDFDVIGVSQGQSYQSINGQITQSKQWIVALAPKHEGQIEIPSFKIGAEQSKPFIIKVNKEPSGDGKKISNRSGAFIEVDANPGIPYVNAQVIYTVKVFLPENRRMDNLELSEPVVAEAHLEKLDKDLQYETTRDGIDYHVIERHYAIFPEKIGPLKITGGALKGLLIEGNSASYDPFGMFSDPLSHSLFQQGKRFRVPVQPMTVEVLPIPEEVKTITHDETFLPAAELHLEEEWSDNQMDHQTGDPITRTITITAKGLTGAQLPSLPEFKNPGVKIYPNTPKIATDATVDGVIGTHSETIAYVAEQPGEITFPEITIHWWNTKTNHLEKSVLPARTIQFSGKALEDKAQEPPADNATISQSKTPEISYERVGQQAPTPTTASNHWLAWSLVGVFAMLWLITLLLLFKRTRSATNDSANSESIDDNKPQSEKQLLDRIYQHCKNNEPLLTAQTLLEYSCVVFQNPQILSLETLIELLNTQTPVKDALIRSLSALNVNLYGLENTSAWDGLSFWQLFKSQLPLAPKQKSTASKTAKPWASLYP